MVKGSGYKRKLLVEEFKQDMNDVMNLNPQSLIKELTIVLE